MKTYNYNQNLTDLKNWYAEARKIPENTMQRAEKVVLRFSEPVTLHYGKFTQFDKTQKEHHIKRLFFLGENGYSNCELKEELEAKKVCYVAGKARTRGFNLHYLDLQKLQQVDVYQKAPIDKKALVQKILDARHPNVWQDLTLEEAMGMAHNCGDYKKTYIKSKFPPYVIDNLKEAFDKKEEYRYTKHGTKRDLTVSTEWVSDGFRAFYSSEYAGCGNGAYYILINPTTAAFVQYD